MSISSVNSVGAMPMISKMQTVASTGKASDGDLKVATAATSSVKDSDGDFKVSPAAPKVSSGVAQALVALQKGG